MTKLKELEKLLTMRKSKEFYAKRLGTTVAHIEELLAEIRLKQKGEGISEEIEFTTTISRNLDKGTYEINTYYDHPPTPEEVIEDHKIDTKLWKLSNYWSKAKGKGWQVSALFSHKSPAENLPEKISEVLSNYNHKYIPLQESDILQNSHYSNPSCLLLSLPDIHIDKLVLENTTLEERVERYFKVLETLLYKSYKSHFLDEIVFVLGNDVLHTDSIHNTTTKGTVVYVDTPWEKAYETAFDMMVKSITKLKQFCNKLKVILVQGNHDRIKEYFLAHALEVYFHHDKNIEFDRSSNNFKCHEYGSTLLLFNHGNNVNDKLPLVFATTFHQEWGRCKYKDVILADKHHNSEKLFRSQGEANGIRMRILPTISGTDQWHSDNLFVNSIPAGIALIYDKEEGKCAEFECRI